ncbi:MAG TPA: tetratricopeptide repeat protein [Candidatus Aminicenantes bacterium]|nr:tetratricopeptide repeat protein [Candidatus Aminicenantes bacterium]
MKRVKTILLVAVLLAFAGSLMMAQAGRGKGRVNGIVEDEYGKPIEGVKIKAEFLQGGQSGEILRDALTDKKGAWSIIAIGSGKWRFTAMKDNYVPNYVEYDVKQLSVNPTLKIVMKVSQQGPKPVIEDEESLKLFDQANQLFTEKKYDEALTVFQQFLTKHPEAFMVSLGIGNCYKELGDLDKAIAEYQKVLDKTQESVKDNSLRTKALSAMGDAYMKKQDFEKAQNYFKEALAITPDDEILAYNVGEIFFNAMKTEEAIAYYEMAAKIKPDWSLPVLKLGYAYLNVNNLPKTLENLNKYMTMDPEGATANGVPALIETVKKMQK